MRTWESTVTLGQAASGDLFAQSRIAGGISSAATYAYNRVLNASGTQRAYMAGEAIGGLLKAILFSKGASAASSVLSIDMAPLYGMSGPGGLASIRHIGYMSISQSSAVTTSEFLTALASNVEANIGGTGWRAGTLKHTAAADWINAYQSKFGPFGGGLLTEPTYFDQRFFGVRIPHLGSYDRM